MTPGNLMLNEVATDDAVGRERLGWRLVARYGCVSDAEVAVSRLRDRGLDATMCAIDGVAVLVRK